MRGHGQKKYDLGPVIDMPHIPLCQWGAYGLPVDISQDIVLTRQAVRVHEFMRRFYKKRAWEKQRPTTRAWANECRRKY